MAGQVVPARVEALPLVSAAPAEKRKCSAKASRKTGARGAPRSTSARGCGPKSVKVVANWTLLDVEMGASNELPLTIRQSFKDGRYSPSTGMEEVEWKIMLEQFIASAVVVWNEVINSDSD
jgi:ribosomal protein L40E